MTSGIIVAFWFLKWNINYSMHEPARCSVYCTDAFACCSACQFFLSWEVISMCSTSCIALISTRLHWCLYEFSLAATWWQRLSAMKIIGLVQEIRRFAHCSLWSDSEPTQVFSLILLITKRNLCSSVITGAFPVHVTYRLMGMCGLSVKAVPENVHDGEKCAHRQRRRRMT